MSNIGIYLLLPLSVLIGFSLASQAGVNSQLRLALSNPIQAAFISFLVGTIILGALVLAISVVCGQVVASLVLDQNGWLGYPKIEITFNRILGAIFLIIGMFLITKK